MAASDLFPINSRSRKRSDDSRAYRGLCLSRSAQRDIDARGERGQSLLETALFFPMLLAFLVGLVQVGLVINTYLIVINAAREGARYGSHDYSYTPAQIASTTQTVAYPLSMSTTNATIIVTRVQTSTTGGVSAITSYTSAYASGLDNTQASRFTSGSVLSRFSQGAQTNGTDEFVIVEFFYRYPLFIWNANVPMYSYTIMRVIGN
jgi:Flp pilus assembly protein TadG